MADAANNINSVRERIYSSAIRAGRRPDEIHLVAVSKTVSVEQIAVAYDCGLRSFAESYLQEAKSKIGIPPLDLPEIEWHFIGHLQSNKAKDVLERFSLVQSVDSHRLASIIGRQAEKTGRIARILLEIKLDPLDEKFGIEPEKALEEALGVSELPGIRLEGLMGIAPYVPAADAGARERASRMAFRRLYNLFSMLPETCRQTLSMGMSGDFEIAIEEGSNLIRVGTAIFGTRT